MIDSIKFDELKAAIETVNKSLNSVDVIKLIDGDLIEAGHTEEEASTQ